MNIESKHSKDRKICVFPWGAMVQVCNGNLQGETAGGVSGGGAGILSGCSTANSPSVGIRKPRGRFEANLNHATNKSANLAGEFYIFAQLKYEEYVNVFYRWIKRSWATVVFNNCGVRYTGGPVYMLLRCVPF